MDGFRNLLAAAALLAAPLVVPAASAQEPSEAEWFADFQAAVDEMRTLLMRRGERVEGWDVGGADPDGDLRAMGTDSYYFLSRTASEDSVAILTDRPIAAFAPGDWQIADTYGGDPAAPGDRQVDFVPLSARYVFAARSRVERRGDAACFGNFDEAILYEIDDAPESEDDEMIPGLFRMTILAMEDQMVCVRTEGDRRRGYRSRAFTPDGYRLPEIDAGNEDEVTTIVPAAPVAALIAWRGRPEPGPTIY